MGELGDAVTTAGEAAEDAARAAARAGVRVDETHGLDGVKVACAVFDATWERTCVPTEMAVAVSHAGGYVAVARAGDEPVGASLAFLGHGQGGPLLHSHITAVTAGLRRGGVGVAVKLHQRAWALAHGVPVVTWTFDPLRRANAWFNLHKLGATAVALHRDFYGTMDDAFNAGDLTDRIEVRWDLASAGVVAAVAGGTAPPDDAALVAAGAAVVLDEGGDGGPVAAPAAPGSGVLLVGLPADPDRLAPERRRAWRLAVRETVGASLDAGLVVAGVTAGRRYVLAPPGDATGTSAAGSSAAGSPPAGSPPSR